MKTKITAILAMVMFLSLFVSVSAFAGTINYTYDNAGRLTGADYGDRKTIAFTYDNNGNLLKRDVQAPAPQKYTLTVTVSPANRGSVTGNGIDCPGDCTHDYDENTDVQLTATPAAENKFLRWEGALTGTTNPDTLTMNADKQVAAYFGSVTNNTDTDGVPDGTESGPDGNNPAYDGNNNGTPDYQEAGAASLPSASGGAYTTIAVADGSGQVLSDVRAEENPSPQDAPADVQFPYGFFTFAIDNLANPGDTATATLYLPKDTAIDTYYQHGPTPDNPADHWYEFMYDGNTGAEIFHEAAQTRIVLHFRDGGRGDKDLVANGRIDDPGAPGIKSTATLATGTPSSYKVTVTKVEMHNGSAWVTLFSSGTALLDMKAGGTFPGISDLNLPSGTYSRVRVTFRNSFPVAGTASYSGTAYYTTATTFGAQTNLASTPTTVAGGMAEFTFRNEDWGALDADVVQTFTITPITVGPATDYQPTLRFTISDTLLLKGTAGDASSYYFSMDAPTASLVEP